MHDYDYEDDDTFGTPREAALALLNSDMSLNRKTGTFLGQVCADDTPLSPKQRKWLDDLLRKAELPDLD